MERDDGSHDRLRAQVTLAMREAMREHAIPSDWMECHALRGTDRRGRQGVHVQFRVKQKGRELLARAIPFESAFTRQLQRISSTAAGRVFSIGWQLEPGSFDDELESTWQFTQAAAGQRAASGASLSR